MQVRHQENHGSMEDTFRGERALGKVGSVLLEGFLVGLGRRHLVCVRRSSRDPASGMRDVADPIFQPAGIRKEGFHICQTRALWRGWEGTAIQLPAPEAGLGSARAGVRALALPWGSAWPSRVPPASSRSPLGRVPSVSTRLWKLK